MYVLLFWIIFNFFKSEFLAFLIILLYYSRKLFFFLFFLFAINLFVNQLQ